MVSITAVEEQLKQIGCNFRFWGRSELKELCEILLPGERIAQVVNGQYEAGFAMLCATDFRVLLIDKKPKYLTLKDIRFDMITELDFSNRIMNSTMRIYTPNRELRFTTPSAKRLRKLFTHVQHKVMEMRNHFTAQQFQHYQELQGLPAGVAQHYAQLPAQDSYSPEPPEKVYGLDEPSHQQQQLASVVGAAGLQGTRVVREGQIVTAYSSVPPARNWHKRPYGYSNTPL